MEISAQERRMVNRRRMRSWAFKKKASGMVYISTSPHSVVEQRFYDPLEYWDLCGRMRQESARDWAKTAMLRYQPIRTNIIQSITIS